MSHNLDYSIDHKVLWTLRRNFDVMMIYTVHVSKYLDYLYHFFVWKKSKSKITAEQIMHFSSSGPSRVVSHMLFLMLYILLDHVYKLNISVPFGSLIPKERPRFLNTYHPCSLLSKMLFSFSASTIAPTYAIIRSFN